MTEAFTAGVMIFIEQFRARWSWSIGCWNPDCRCLLPKSRRLPFSGFLPLDVSSPPVGDIFRSGRCMCVRCSGSASFSNPQIASPTSKLIFRPFRHFTYVTAHSIAIQWLHLRHRHFTYVTAHSQTLFSPLLRHRIFTYVTWRAAHAIHLRHNSFSNISVALPTSQLILQLFRCFTYVIGTSPKKRPILQPFHCFTYITAHSTILPLLHLRHRHFT